MSKVTNNMTPCVENALAILKDLYAHEASKSKVNHLLLAFGNNKGFLQRVNRFSTRCTITRIQPITAKDVNNIKSATLQRKVAEFLCNNQVARDTDVLEYIKKFGWSEYDTSYTTQQHKSFTSTSLVTRAAYIAIQKLKEELDEFYMNEKENAKEVQEITFSDIATETVNIFELAEKTTKKPSRAKKPLTVTE